MNQKDKIRKILNEANVILNKDQFKDMSDSGELEDLPDDTTIRVDDKVTENENGEQSMYVEYMSDKPDEEPFEIDGVKYEYVWARYPDGKKDIGVYIYGQDLVYNINWFQDNILKKTSGVNEYDKGVMKSFKDQYGKEQGEKIYYATANKQDRDPETFEKNEQDVPQDDYERMDREVEYGQDAYGDIELPNDKPMDVSTCWGEPWCDDHERQSRETEYGVNRMYETVKPKMTKGDLEEAIGKKVKVLKTIKLKDIK
jgi:hypothetical protein